jgi:hypothetical protein
MTKKNKSSGKPPQSGKKLADLLEVDKPIAGQNFACISFVSPEKILKDKNLFIFECFLKNWEFNKSMEKFIQFNNFISYKYNIPADKLKEDYDEFVREEGETLREGNVTDDYKNFLDMNEEKWNSYTKFCFIRNPYDRAYSGWKHMNIVLNKTSIFYDYISQNKYNVSDIEYAHVFMNQKTHIQDENGNCGINIIGKFETLEDDFKKILKHLGYTRFLHREKKVNVSNIEESDVLKLDIKTIRRLNEICNEDLDTFHYKKLIL